MTRGQMYRTLAMVVPFVVACIVVACTTAQVEKSGEVAGKVAGAVTNNSAIATAVVTIWTWIGALFSTDPIAQASITGAVYAASLTEGGRAIQRRSARKKKEANHVA